MNFVRLTREQQMDVINRTFHGDDRVAAARANSSRNVEAGRTGGPSARRATSPSSSREPGRARPGVGRRGGPGLPGDMGFLHSPSPPDRPWIIRHCASSHGRPAVCGAAACHNPDTWTMSNGIPVAVTKAVELRNAARA